MDLKASSAPGKACETPAGWELAAFGEIVGAFIDYRGRTPRKLGMDWGGGNILALSANNVQMGRIAPEKEANFGSEELYQKWMRQGECAQGDVLLTMEAPLGNVAQIPDRQKYILSQRVLLIKPNARVERDFLFHLMQGGRFQGALEQNSTGSTAKGIQRARLETLETLLPQSTAEQLLIATALGDADALLAAQDALIAKKRAIKQGAMQELLTGKRRLPGFSGLWEVKRLGCLLESPITDGPHHTPRFLDRGIPFLSVNNLVDGRIDWSDLRYISDVDHREFSRKCRPRKGDILFGKAASVGMVAFVDTEVDFNIWSPIALIRVAPKFSAKFVYRQLQSISVEKQVLLLTNSSSQGNIGMGDIGRLEIAHPKCRDEQTAIAAILDDLDHEIAALEARRAKITLLKQGMLQELLIGRIRLV